MASAQGGADHPDRDWLRRLVVQGPHGIFADEQRLAGCSQPTNVLELGRVVFGPGAGQGIHVDLGGSTDSYMQAVRLGFADPFVESDHATGTRLVQDEQAGIPGQEADQAASEDAAVQIRSLAGAEPHGHDDRSSQGVLCRRGVVWAGAWEDRMHRGANSNTDRMPPRHFFSRRLLLYELSGSSIQRQRITLKSRHRSALASRACPFETPYPLYWEMR